MLKNLPLLGIDLYFQVKKSKTDKCVVYAMRKYKP
jgi:hypothetical protein